jgi:cell filamentation protein
LQIIQDDFENENMSSTKVSIRFFNDREVRAVWDEENAKWWFSVLDIVAVLTEQSVYSYYYEEND